MAYCHLPSVTVLEELLDKLPNLSYERALTVAEGDGKLIKDLLKIKFKVISPRGVSQCSIMKARAKTSSCSPWFSL